MKQCRTDLYAKPAFILSLAALLANDMVFKYAYPGSVTGKLSDFAGLFAFSFFFACLQVRWSGMVHITTAVLFMYWKSPLSQGLIEWMNSLGVMATRVVDYTDLLALIVLPISYKYLEKRKATIPQRAGLQQVGLALVSLVAFTATTIPQKPVRMDRRVYYDYSLDMSKETFFKSISAPSSSHGMEKPWEESEVYLIYNLEEIDVTVRTLATVTEPDTLRTMVRTDSILEAFTMGGRRAEHLNNITSMEYADYIGEVLKRIDTTKVNKHIMYMIKENR